MIDMKVDVKEDDFASDTHGSAVHSSTGNAALQYHHGRRFWLGQGVPQDRAEAVKWFRGAADQGHVEAQFNLAVAYANGDGVTRDDIEAAKWFRLAAEQGYLEAQFKLGEMLAEGRGITKNKSEAVRWHRRAAKQGYARAQFILGVAYAFGRGTTRDYAKAIKWFRRAAKQGHARAQFNLGVSYGKGRGVTRDCVEAFRWYQLAAQQGFTSAQFNLGVMYANGDGITRDDVEAVRWYQLAAQQGHAEAERNLRWIQRNGSKAVRKIADATPSKIPSGDTSAKGPSGRIESPRITEAIRYRHDIQDVLNALRNDMVPQPQTVALPRGMDRTILQDLRLQVRTWNCLRGAGLLEGNSLITTDDLLRINNFGLKSLSDLVFTVDDYLRDCIGNAPLRLPEKCSSIDDIKPQESRDNTEPPTSLAVDGWSRAATVLSPLFAAAAELDNAKTVSEMLKPEYMQLAVRMDTVSAIEKCRIDVLANGALGPVAVVTKRLSSQLDSLTPKQSTVVHHRILNTPATKIKEVAAMIGVSRQRVHQIQNNAMRQVNRAFGKEMTVIAETVKEKLDHIVEENVVDSRIDNLLSHDIPWMTAPVRKLFRQELINRMGFKFRESMCIDCQAEELLETIRCSIRRAADDVGLINELQAQSFLPSGTWHQFWPRVRQLLGLQEMHGSLGLRDTAKARVKAALLAIGQPATREEIASVCELEPAEVGKHLANVSSVVKADKSRWGLKEWVDDEYNGILAEIVQRIEEDGGSTTTERILNELPSKFNVAKNSVRAYMLTRRFSIQDGMISLADPATVQLRMLDDVIDGRDSSGAPYWSFKVEARFFRGHSVTGVPPEVVRALGCDANGSRMVRIENMPDCRHLSLNWRLSSPGGGTLGYVGEPLRRLKLKPGDRARLTIKEPCLAELSVDTCKAIHDNEADEILERMLERRKVL